MIFKARAAIVRHGFIGGNQARFWIFLLRQFYFLTLMPACFIAASTSLRALSLALTKGRRTSSRQKPKLLRAYLVGAGLVSQKIALQSGARRSRILANVFKSPLTQASCIFACCDGAILAATEMQPCPPWAWNAVDVSSLPVSWQKLGPTLSRSKGGRDRSPVASFTPIILDSFARRAMVSMLMSMTDRPGIL